MAPSVPGRRAAVGPPERPARPPTLPVQTGTRSPVALWDDVQVRPPAKLQPKAHGALYRRPGPETHPAEPLPGHKTQD